MASPRRPQTVQNVNFRHVPILKEEYKEYIMMTQEILDVFKERIVKSHTVTLKLNNVRYKECRKPKSRAPFFFPGKASTSLDDLKETVYRRPVRVFVDDITQQFEQKSNNLDTETPGSGWKRKRSWQKHAQMHTLSSNMKMKRSMDSGDEGNDIPDDIIETVARVNTMHIEQTPVLPEIRAAPCPIHTKRLLKGQENGPLGKDLLSPRRVSMQLTKSNSFQHINPSQQNNSTKVNRVDINVRIPEQFPRQPPPLPKNMSSKDYVMTWLIHGSEPQGSNHFPEIIPNNMKSRTKHTPRKANISE